MNLRLQKRLLILVACALTASGIGVVVWAVVWPADGLGKLAREPGRSVRRSGNQPQESVPPLAEFQQVWDKPLRRALVDLPPASAADSEAVQPSSSPLTVKLIGTIVEGDRVTAMFSLADGAVELKEEGELIEGATIVSIKKWGVTLRVADQLHELRLEENRFEGLPLESEPAN